MKILKLIILSVLFINHSYGQNSCPDIKAVFAQEITTVSLGTAKKAVYIKGDKALKLKNFFFGNKEKRNYIQKVRHLKIPGFQNEVELSVHDGVHGCDPTKGSLYFHTFRNRKDKTEKIKHINENQKRGIIVYFKKKGEDKVQTNADVKALISYFECLLSAKA